MIKLTNLIEINVLNPNGVVAFLNRYIDEFNAAAHTKVDKFESYQHNNHAIWGDAEDDGVEASFDKKVLGNFRDYEIGKVQIHNKFIYYIHY